MKFKEDIIWLEKDGSNLFFGDDVCLKISGTLGKELARCAQLNLGFIDLLAKYKDSSDFEKIMSLLKNCFSEEFNPIFERESLLDSVLKLDDNTIIEVIDLSPSFNGQAISIEVYAKYPDPTSMVGPGGYDDDLPCM